jgi:hypothetical protein
MAAAVTVEYAYRYPRASICKHSDEGADLALSTSGGSESSPAFFRGFLGLPRQTARLMLAVAQVARTRFYTPAAMTAAVIRAADPVVTSNGDRLRFEAFSSCGGVYIRLDVGGDLLDGAFVGMGTTNVDFNAVMRDALGRIGDADVAHLSVGPDDVVLLTEDGAVIERRVPLPVRWLKGFGEVQATQQRMALSHELSQVQTRRFLSSLARTPGKGQFWAVPTGRGLVPGRSPAPGAVPIGGLERLRGLADHVRYARRLRVFTFGGASAWELSVEGATLHLLLSPQKDRGFSGEGGVLIDLLDEDAHLAAEKLRHHLGWQPRLDVVELAATTGLDRRAVTKGLSVLGATGVVGYDLALGACFHRELPFDLSGLIALYPRLGGAVRLQGESGVRVLGRSSTDMVAEVTSGEKVYRVCMTGPEATCTCPWYRNHGSSSAGERPCLRRGC